jgi:malonyl CoA-acyl carrier protein transacylase
MIAFVFPGQGSQKRGMGEGLFDQPEYASVEKQVDSLLGYSARQLCLADPENKLRDTRYTQPCLYIVNALHHYKALRDGMRPDFLAGHSLGEYNALLAAGVFDFITGLRLVVKRGQLMAQARNGGMAAVVGLNGTAVSQVLKDANLSSVDVANFNSPMQTVISGPLEDIKRAAPAFEKAGVQMYVPLPVSAAFHSRYMQDAASEFADFLAPMTFAAGQIPIVANVTAQPYPAQSADFSAAVKQLLVQQITHSVLWFQSVRFMMAKGVTRFTEIGPGNVLARLIQQI